MISSESTCGQEKDFTLPHLSRENKDTDQYFLLLLGSALGIYSPKGTQLTQKDAAAKY